MSLDNTIPKGWNKSNIGELCNVYIGGDILKKHFSKYKTQKFKYPIYSNGTGKNALYGYSDICVINSPCITVTARGSIGYCLIHNEPIYPIIRLIVLTSKQIFLPYLKYFLDYINIEASSAGIPQLTAPMIKQLQILYPAYNEQVKIVNVLKNIDKLIYNLEILIKKKESIKKGLIQELLTCKKRLYGFTDKWKNIKLNEICDFISGFSFASNDFIETGIALIKISNINNETVKVDNDTVYLPLDYLKKYEKFLIKYNDLLIAMSGATTGKMGVYKLKRNALLNQRVGIIRAKKGYSQMFLTYILQMYVTTILEMALGGAQPNISANVINKIKIDIPISLNEQNAIANIIGNIDSEILILKNKLSKYRQIKQGIMEELLTGKKRL